MGRIDSFTASLQSLNLPAPQKYKMLWIADQRGALAKGVWHDDERSGGSTETVGGTTSRAGRGRNATCGAVPCLYAPSDVTGRCQRLEPPDHQTPVVGQLFSPQCRWRHVGGKPGRCARCTRSDRPALAGRSMGSDGVLGKHVFSGLRPARGWCAGFRGPGIVSWIIDRLD